MWPFKKKKKKVEFVPPMQRYEVYESIKQCPKCWRERDLMFKVVYRKSTVEIMMGLFGRVKAGISLEPEMMITTCPNCGYEIKEACRPDLDTQPDAPQGPPHTCMWCSTLTSNDKDNVCNNPDCITASKEK